VFFSGTATVAEYEALLRSVSFAPQLDGPATPVTFTFTVVNFEAVSAPATRTVEQVREVPVNEAPVVTTTAGSTSFIYNGGPVVVDPGLTVSDPDSHFLSGAAVSVQANGVFPNQLDFDLPAGSAITVVGVGSGGVAFEGTATVAEYEALLRSIAYTSLSDDPTGPVTVTFTVVNFEASASAAKTVVESAALNQAPVVTTSGGSTTHIADGGPVVVDPGLTISDPDSEFLSGAVVSSNGFGTTGFDLPESGNIVAAPLGPGSVSFSGTATVAEYEALLRSVRFDPQPDGPTTPVTFTFAVDNFGTDGAAATKLVEIVNPANEPPQTAPTFAPPMP
jgi:hypothetical protein